MLVIDRWEGKWAVILYGKTRFNLPKELLPPGAREGDVIELEVSVNREATTKRSKAINKKVGKLFDE